MKKLFSLLVSCMALCFATSCFAQDLGGVYVRFCNNDEETKNLNMILESGKEGEICIDFLNESSEDVTIKYGFVDGVVTADEFKNKACKNEGDIANFGQYVTQQTDSISIPALSSVRQKATIKFPFGLSGMMNGCLTYYVGTESNINSDSMFNILVRKAQFIDVLVGGKLERHIKLADNNGFTYNYDKSTKSYNIEVSLQNVGNVDELVSILGTVSNKFGFNIDVSSDERKVLSDDAESFVLNIGKLPWYKMRYDINLNVVSNPKFVFSTDLISDGLKNTIEIPLHLSIFVFPWAFVYMFIGLIVLIILIRWLSKHLRFK